MKEKLWLPDLIRTLMADDEREAKKAGKKFEWKLLFGDHHESHAASAFYPSPFEEAAMLTIDGVGEWATSSMGIGRGNEITLIKDHRCVPKPDRMPRDRQHEFQRLRRTDCVHA